MGAPSNLDERAGWEHLFRHGQFPPRYRADAAPNDSVVEWANTISANSYILDVGCGVGRHVLYLGGRGFKIAGIDLSSHGIKATQEACAQRHYEFVGRVADMTEIPWADMTFDAALSTSVICHHLRRDIFKAISEVKRVLKPGGSFLVDFPHKNTLSYQRARHQVQTGELSEVEPDTFVDENPNPDFNDDAFLPHHYCDEAEVRDLMASFEIIKLWTDIPESSIETGLPQRGHWIVWARKLS